MGMGALMWGWWLPRLRVGGLDGAGGIRMGLGASGWGWGLPRSRVGGLDGGGGGLDGAGDPPERW